MPYLIDGHNLIGAIPGLSLADLDDELALIRRLTEYAQKHQRSITVYFDRGSLAAPQLTNAGRVKVQFVRPPRTADDAIRAHLRRLDREATNWTVVTSDRAVASAARQVGATVVKSQDFARQMLPVDNEATEDEKPDRPLEPDEIESWEKLFGGGDGEAHS